MFRDFLSNRAIFAGLVFFMVIVGSSLICSWHARRAIDAELARTNPVLQHVNRNETHTAADTVDTSTVDFEHAETPLEVDDLQGAEDTDVSLIDEASEFADVVDAFLPDDFVSAESQVSEDVPVSPHGFGAYPEVPADFPEDVNWSDYEEDLPIYELMTRVQIKLWKQGHRAMGISEENGVMYPVIRGRVYIKWSRSGKEVLEVTGHPTDMSDAIVNQIESGIIPAGLTVLNYDTAGIDPYEFLNLQ